MRGAQLRGACNERFSKMQTEKVWTLDEVKADWARVKCEVAYVRTIVAAHQLMKTLRRQEKQKRLEAESLKYREDQPRVPAGNPGTGGQWTGSGAGSGVARDSASDSVKKPVQTALLEFAPIVFEKAAEAAIYLYLYWASRNSQQKTAVIEFNSREFLPGALPSDPAIGTRVLNEEEVNASCPRDRLVQAMTDAAAQKVQSQWGPLTPQQYGTRVHTALRDSIVALADPNLKAEISAIKSVGKNYGKKGSIRIDAFENVGDGTVCVYDIKTGEAKLTLLRMQEIADNAHSLFPGTTKLRIIEKRPR
jgi:hypothetical protein